MKLKEYELWFVVGGQSLHEPQVLDIVAVRAAEVAGRMNESGSLPCRLVYKGTVKTNEEITSIMKEVNYADACVGVVTWCHTLSPGKMWIGGFAQLQKPCCHLATQYHREIPNEEIDMDFMNLNQPAYGDREHGFIAARLRLARKVIAGYWEDETIQKCLDSWICATMGAAFSKGLKAMCFDDNMREVAVTRGDKMEVQTKLGWQVNAWSIGQLAERINAVIDTEIDTLMEIYHAEYDFSTEDLEAVRYQAREEIAMKAMLDTENCRVFSNIFQDLYGMKRLPGLVTWHLMAQDYGYGGEGDWKTATMTAILKAMSEGQSGGSTFMEDYNYRLAQGNEYSPGTHMPEVCPSVVATRPRIGVHPLGIGDREAPTRLVFEGHAGPAAVISLIGIDGRLRLIRQDIECVKPILEMPNLPVTYVMWGAIPNLITGVGAWITAGDAHHTVPSYDVIAVQMRDWVQMVEIEFVHIGKDTTIESPERDLFLSDLTWKLR